MRSVKEILRPLARIESPKEIIRHFSPSWFAVTMGTGILAVDLQDFPFPFHHLFDLAWAFWWLNVGLFIVFSILFLARWAFFFNDAVSLFSHPVQSMFLGAIPVGLSTIIEGMVLFCVPTWGPRFVTLAEVLWCINVVLALVSCVLVSIYMISTHEHSLKKMTAVWVIPIIPAVSAAAAGAIILPTMANITFARYIAFLSTVLWGISVPVTLNILCIFFLRLVLHKLPPNDVIISCFLPLGPIGSAALAATALSTVAPRVFASSGDALSDVAYESLASSTSATGILVGCALWGYGLWWLGLAIFAVTKTLIDRLPFNLGWWGLIFPLGVFSDATVYLYKLTQLLFFKISASIFISVLFILWWIVMVHTLTRAYTGELFYSPSHFPQMTQSEAANFDLEV
ncbi:hypothetical protein GAYE_SCF26G4616 [Galdieria yellowstonensis]|uniref:C4-dicarboxylate transporter/malic acid transport protein n=1 Tax=Galdieria yellowstonensis TaxID=3028027 RepID=A0AAV9IH60_9RHOD|nr:hypothetical protein GAYE_SCF26G4616 [Galdieria yellowstonensis]